MKNTYRIIPIYTGDVSGIASALYELGGMTVIHDPSGCNSTYNTHDETRWYDEESLIYISGLTEVDAIIGNDNKFIEDILYAAQQMKPAFIALVSAPIPYLNGTDFPGIARLVEKRSGIPTFFVPSNGTHDYSIGVGNAFLELGKRIIVPKRGKCSRTSLNILGLTPLDFDAEGAVASLKEKLSDFEIISCWAMDDTIENLKDAAAADVNLVVSVTGLALAKWMRQEYGIPYVEGVPVGAYAPVLREKLRAAAEGRIQEEKTAPLNEQDKIYLVGEPVLMDSLRNHIVLTAHRSPIVVDPLEEDCDLADVRTVGEEDLEELLKDAKTVVADPLYRPIVPETAHFIGLGHEAFSGRCFRKERKNLLKEEEIPYVNE